MIEIPIYDDTFLSGLMCAGYPMDETASEIERRKVVHELSLFTIRLSNTLIYYAISNLKEAFKLEENNVAFAILQRAAIYHISNHKLSTEGIWATYQECKMPIADEFKTMPLTRSVYEHLVMFYYLFNYTDDANQREIIWKSWILGSKKNQAKASFHEFEKERLKAQEEINKICVSLAQNELVMICLSNPKGQYDYCLKSGSLFCVGLKGDKYIAEKLTYDKAWKMLYGEDLNLSLLYSYMSLHAHPTYNGLLEFGHQETHIDFPLYDSCLFLTYLCRLFMKQLGIDKNIIIGTYTEREKGIFSYMSNENKIY